MKTILRYPLFLTYRQKLTLPSNFVVRHVAPGRATDVDIDLWAEVDDANHYVPVNVWIVGTGHEISFGGAHVGTVVMPDDYVWHVFVGWCMP